jgi:transcriptional regulator with XRE-family HTH domain
MTTGEVLRAARQAAGLSLSVMASRTHFCKSMLSQVETGKRTATVAVVTAYERVLGVPFSDVQRRDFLKVAGLIAGNAVVVTDLAASLAGNDSVPLTMVQTTYGIDLALATLVDRGGVAHLRGWLDDGNPVLRVNAAGILAKLPGQRESTTVAAVLARDPDVSSRYATAVVSRLFGLGWARSAELAADPTLFPRPEMAARRLADEVLTDRDAGARWCSAMLLQNLSPVIGR